MAVILPYYIQHNHKTNKIPDDLTRIGQNRVHKIKLFNHMHILPKEEKEHKIYFGAAFDHPPHLFFL